MVTLDEVIRAIEECQDSYVAGKIIKSDALEYLKKLKRIEAKIEKIAIGNVEDTLSKMDNPPLTWDELKGMEGKPVWVELLKGSSKGWDVVGGFTDDDFGDVMVTVRGDDYYFADLGKTWQAYRKERE